MTAARAMSPAPSPAWHGVHCRESSLPRSACSSLPPDRRGRLKNGNRSGDFLSAPRCGTRTRCGGECRQPAMANGRCRMHGGLSTGPRTAAGLARSRRARWKHGARSTEVAALRRAARTQLRRVRTILARTHISAGHGVHRSKPRSDVGARCARPSSSTRASSSGTSRLNEARARAARPYTNPSKESAAAGHGVHRSISQPQPISAHPRSPMAKSPSPAWHGVVRSFRDRLRASASFSAIRAVLRSPAPNEPLSGAGRGWRA
jgi:hypothetical protein